MKEVNSVKTTSAGDVYGESPIKSDRLELSASSAGDIKLEVNAKNIDIDISSSGDITLKGETDMLRVDLSSAGDLNAYELRSREADISVSSAGDADVNVSERITARASSAGDINYKGDPKYVDCPFFKCRWYSQKITSKPKYFQSLIKAAGFIPTAFFLTL